MICFSVVSRASFENVPSWIKEVNEVKEQMEAHKKKSAPPLKFIVSGLKTDLMGVSGGLVKSAELIVRDSFSVLLRHSVLGATWRNLEIWGLLIFNSR